MENFIEHIAYLMANPKGALWVDTYNAFRSHSVSTAGEAQRLGECAAHKIYDGKVNFGAYPRISVSDHGYEWCVSYGLPEIPAVDVGNGLVHCTSGSGYGGPEIYINKSTGKITSFALQK